jgi:hypothetical protein
MHYRKTSEHLIPLIESALLELASVGRADHGTVPIFSRYQPTVSARYGSIAWPVPSRISVLLILSLEVFTARDLRQTGKTPMGR